MSAVMDLIDRAALDPDFLSRLADDPFGTAASEGYEISPEEVGSILGLPAGDETELVEALQERLSHSEKYPVSTERSVGGVRG